MTVAPETMSIDDDCDCNPNDDAFDTNGNGTNCDCEDENGNDFFDPGECDNKVDEVPGVGAACGVTIGECTAGILLCTTSGTLECNGSNPGTETCDGDDEDCDGPSDEDFNVGGLCNNGQQGECFREGLLQCDGMGGVECNAPTIVPGARSRGGTVRPPRSGGIRRHYRSLARPTTSRAANVARRNTTSREKVGDRKRWSRSAMPREPGAIECLGRRWSNGDAHGGDDRRRVPVRCRHRRLLEAAARPAWQT